MRSSGLGEHRVNEAHWPSSSCRCARLRFPPTNHDWAFEMQVEDRDGNVLRLGSPPRDGVPYGDFLDAAGVRWPMAAPDA